MGKVLTLNSDLLKESGVPRAFWSLGVDTYLGPRKAINTVNSYVRQQAHFLRRNLGLTIRGPAESYKTFLLTYAVKCILAGNYDATYIRFKTLCDLHFSRETDFDRELGMPDFLALDDLCSPPNKGEVDALLRLIKLRKDEGKPILVATTYADEEFSHLYGSDVLAYFHNYSATVETNSMAFISAKEAAERKERLKTED